MDGLHSSLGCGSDGLEFKVCSRVEIGNVNLCSRVGEQHLVGDDIHLGVEVSIGMFLNFGEPSFGEDQRFAEGHCLVPPSCKERLPSLGILNEEASKLADRGLGLLSDCALAGTGLTNGDLFEAGTVNVGNLDNGQVPMYEAVEKIHPRGWAELVVDV